MAALRRDISFRYLKQFFLVISLNKLAVLIFFSLGKNLIVILDDLKVQSKCLLAHLAKGNVSFCYHLASVVR
jgi:type IV secretory pathway VirB4 component